MTLINLIEELQEQLKEVGPGAHVVGVVEADLIDDLTVEDVAVDRDNNIVEIRLAWG